MACRKATRARTVLRKATPAAVVRMAHLKAILAEAVARTVHPQDIPVVAVVCRKVTPELAVARMDHPKATLVAATECRKATPELVRDRRLAVSPVLAADLRAEVALPPTVLQVRTPTTEPWTLTSSLRRASASC